ncbi:unnamed protein product, partial [Soboliphyme baturini]|uniref:Uncharacterized protein n=1 Tax=Soboliphyme baturini TaxID=241478 RepID=A0A183IAD2_9BILA
MEERSRLAAGLQLSARELSVQPQLLADRYHSQNRERNAVNEKEVPNAALEEITEQEPMTTADAAAGYQSNTTAVKETDEEVDESEEVLNELANQFTFSPSEKQLRLEEENRRFQRR